MDDDLERFAEHLKRLLAEHDTAVVDEMERLINNEPAVPDGQVILFGYEGQVDITFDVPEPYPELLRRAIPPSSRQWLPERDGPVTPWLRTATYQRVGQFTYRRIE